MGWDEDGIMKVPKRGEERGGGTLLCLFRAEHDMKRSPPMLPAQGCNFSTNMLYSYFTASGIECF